MLLCVLDMIYLLFIFKFKTLQPQLYDKKNSEVISHFAIKASLGCNDF